MQLIKLLVRLTLQKKLSKMFLKLGEHEVDIFYCYGYHLDSMYVFNSGNQI